jgi:hypothetical protein
MSHTFWLIKYSKTLSLCLSERVIEAVKQQMHIFIFSAVHHTMLIPNSCMACEIYALTICNHYISFQCVIHIILKICYCKVPLNQHYHSLFINFSLYIWCQCCLWYHLVSWCNGCTFSANTYFMQVILQLTTFVVYVV